MCQSSHLKVFGDHFGIQFYGFPQTDSHLSKHNSLKDFSFLHGLGGHGSHVIMLPHACVSHWLLGYVRAGTSPFLCYSFIILFYSRWEIPFIAPLFAFVKYFAFVKSICSLFFYMHFRGLNLWKFSLGLQWTCRADIFTKLSTSILSISMVYLSSYLTIFSALELHFYVVFH